MTQVLIFLVFIHYTYAVFVVESWIVVNHLQMNIPHQRYQHSQNIVRVSVSYVLVLRVKCPFKLQVKTKGEVTENVNFNSKVKLIASQLGFRVEEKHENILTLHKAIFSK